MSKDSLTKNLTIDLVATVLEGLQVPYSLNPMWLGTAAAPWKALHEAVGFGWHTKEVYAKWLEENLGEDL